MVSRKMLSDMQPMTHYNDRGAYYYLDHKYSSEPWGAYRTPKSLKNKYKEIFPCPNCGQDVVATVMNQFVCPRCGKVVLKKCRGAKSSHPKREN